MKKVAKTCIVLFSLSLLLTGCREEKSTGEKVEDAVENVADDVEDAVD
ncbi:hypothetical protein [Olleya namhaensis]|uniref:Entericidin EcnA/B family protein n=1 Tax=Olleya namhaensis TaxID=1144750 RepID=A0A1I3RC60_9FLAO|nr:hypothetical protein [Olleya namhaensis]SFJ42951.1 hypothetical protein SAMN05443431_107189 [Olleya namhaensis]